MSMEPNTLGNGMRIKSMDMAKNLGQMATNMKVATSMVKNTVRDVSPGRMAQHTPGILLITKFMGKESISGQMEDDTRAIGKTRKCTVMGNSPGQTDDITLVNTSKIGSMVTVRSYGLMVDVTRATGMATDRTGLDFS